MDLSIGRRRDESNRETSREQDLPGKNLWRDGRRRVEDRGQQSQHQGIAVDGGLGRPPNHQQR